MRITALSATAIVAVILSGAPALAATPQDPAPSSPVAANGDVTHDAEVGAGNADSSSESGSRSGASAEAGKDITDGAEPAETTSEAQAEPSPESSPEPSPAVNPEPNPQPTAEPSPEPTAKPTDMGTPEPTSAPKPTSAPEPSPDTRTSASTEPTPEPTSDQADEPTPDPADEPTEKPSPEPTEEPQKPVKPSSMKNRGEWYQVYVDGKPATDGSRFSAVERAKNGSVRTRDFIIGKGGRVFLLDTSKPQNKGKPVDPRVMTLKLENGSVEFINQPTPKPPVSPTPPPTTPPGDGQTPPGDDSGGQDPPRPKPPVQEPPGENPQGEDERHPGHRPDGQDDQNKDDEGPDDEKDDNNQEANDRTQDPDTGNGTVPGQAGTDWTPSNSGDEQTRAPDYSDPVPRNPNDAGDASEDIIAGPEPSHENHSSASAEPSKGGKDTAKDTASNEAGSFPWALAVLLGAGVIGLLLAVFIFARRKSSQD